MTNKIIKRIIKIILILMIIQMSLNVPVAKAADGWTGVFESANNFINTGKNEVSQNEVINQNELKKINSNIYNMLLALGIVLSVIIGGILGIQMMWGSIEQQVKAKEMLMPFAIGCVVIFGAFGIWRICVTIFSQV